MNLADKAVGFFFTLLFIDDSEVVAWMSLILLKTGIHSRTIFVYFILTPFSSGEDLYVTALP